MAQQKSTESRSRNWTFTVWPDSAPDDWRQIVDDQHVPWCESPLHEFDTDPNGELKKAHYHVVMKFSGKKTYAQVKAITDSINAPHPQYVQDLCGMVRYFAHLDNPEKHPYSPSDIVAHAGFDLADALRPTASKRYELIDEMCAWCESTCCEEFADLVTFARVERRDDWFPLLCDSCAFIMKEFLKSRRFKKKGV